MVQLDYFYGAEADNFTFFRIPKRLFTDDRFADVSDSAKLLYGLMLDRLQLSIRNGWFDEQHRAYIRYSVAQIMKDMRCGNQKACKLLKELDKKNGIGLIESKRLGLGQANVYYVLNFASGGDDGDKNGANNPSGDSGTSGQFDHSRPFTETKQPLQNGANAPETLAAPQKCENHISGSVKTTSQEMCKSHDSKRENHTTGSVKITSAEVWDSHANKTDLNDTDSSDTDSSSFSVVPMMEEAHPRMEHDYEEAKQAQVLLAERARYDAYLRKQLDYDNTMKRLEFNEKEEFDGYFDLILGVLCSQRKLIRIEGDMIPIALVKSEFMKLTADDVLDVMERVGNWSDAEIGNIDGYVITALYRNRRTTTSRIRQKVTYDLYGEGRNAQNDNKSDTSGNDDQYMAFIKQHNLQTGGGG